MEQSRPILENATERAREYDVELNTATRTGRPTRETLAYADEHDVTHIVMGSHGREGIERALLGSVTDRVLRLTTRPATVVKTEVSE